MVKITGIIKRSAAQAANIMPGDILVSINGHDINDVLDYMYYAAVDRLALILLRNNLQVEADIFKGEYDDLGLEFNSFLMDDKKVATISAFFAS